MPSNSTSIAPINWKAVVAEAKRRRKSEGLTQKEHAALAGVSIPTIIAFDRGELTQSLGKAFDILRVVGLLDEEERLDTQAAFVQHAMERWRELIEPLPADSPARFPHGWFRIDYALQGELQEIEPYALLPVIDKNRLHNTGWPMFITVTQQDLAPYEHDGVLECWMKPHDDRIDRALSDPAHCDFWQASSNGRFVLLRGYAEDSQDTFKPGTIFDTTLPIWRIAEAMLHAGRMAAALKASQSTLIQIEFRVFYTGLSGRILRSWANPLADLFIEGGAAKSDEATLQTSFPAEDVEQHLAELLYPMIASLFDRFGVSGLSVERVAAELKRFQESRLP